MWKAGRRTPGVPVPPPSSPTGPTRPRSTGPWPSWPGSRRWCSPARHAPSRPPSARWRPATASCCRPATAPSPSTPSRPTPSATSSRSSSRWPCCSPTGPACRWDMVNDLAPLLEARRPDPARMLRAYHQSSATLNLLRAFTKGGFADLNQVHTWNQEFVAASPAGQRYEAVAVGIDRALRFMAACGIDLTASSALHQVDFYTSHEALLLGYEQAMTRRDSLTGCWYDCSAHLLWVGDRTRQLDGAHLEFLRGVGNPVAAKLGPTATPEETVALCDLLDPGRVPGRLTLVARMGASRVEELLPPLVRAVRDAGHPVVWACDPMHGNTFVGPSGHKTRRFDDVMRELAGFFAVHRSQGTHPGGIHVELTGEDVTECLGGADEILDGHLHRRYETACDPRLNASQALELAFQVAELL